MEPSWSYVCHRLSPIETGGCSIERKQARIWIANRNGVAQPSAHQHSRERHQIGLRIRAAIGVQNVLVVFGRWSSHTRLFSTQEDEGIASCQRGRWPVSVRALPSNRYPPHEELPEAIGLRFLAKERDINCSETAIEVPFMRANRTHRARLPAFGVLQLRSSRSSCEHLQESS